MCMYEHRFICMNIDTFMQTYIPWLQPMGGPGSNDIPTTMSKPPVSSFLSTIKRTQIFGEMANSRARAKNCILSLEFLVVLENYKVLKE